MDDVEKVLKAKETRRGDREHGVCHNKNDQGAGVAQRGESPHHAATSCSAVKERAFTSSSRVAPDGNSATIWPRIITRYRSQARGSSSSSDETSSTAVPASASSFTSRKIS